MLLEKQLYEVVRSSRESLDCNLMNIDGTLEKLELRKAKVAEVRKRARRLFELSRAQHDLKNSEEKTRVQSERDKMQRELDDSKALLLNDIELNRRERVERITELFRS